MLFMTLALRRGEFHFLGGMERKQQMERILNDRGGLASKPPLGQVVYDRSIHIADIGNAFAFAF